MLVARSYTHSTMSSGSLRTNRKDSSRQSKPKKESKERRTENKTDGKPKIMSTLTSPTSSRPVVIPTKTSTSKRRTKQEQSLPSHHDVDAVPPSMAALLAIASIHNSSNISSRREIVEKLLQKENLSPDDFRFTLSSSSPKSWNILQSPPGEEEETKETETDAFSLTSASTGALLPSYRSLSYDSMPSLDLEIDFESPGLTLPPTPAYRARTEKKKIMSPRASISGTEHPLSPPIEQDLDLQTPTVEKTFDLELPPPRAPTPKSLKSNLTASIRMLKSAAITTFSTISPTQYTPNPLSSFSSPESPNTQQARPKTVPLVLANIDALPFHMTTPLPELPLSSTSIQLMPYSPSTVSASESATAPPVFLPATPSNETLERKLLLRPREPRENSDFLRIVVLEMNMRRVGKLNSEGRARIWLGPRKDARFEHEDVVEHRNGEQRRSSAVVPARWTVFTA